MQPQQWCCVCLRGVDVKHLFSAAGQNALNKPPPADRGGGCYDLQIVVVVGLFGEPAAVWAACCPERHPNLLRLTFHAAGARPFIRNFDEVGPFMLQRVYRELAAARNDKALAFIDELREDKTIPAHWLSRPPALSAPPPVLPLILGRDGLELRLFSMISTFGTPYDITTDEIRVETFFPEDAASEALLKALLP